MNTYGMADARPTKTPAEVAPMFIEKAKVVSRGHRIFHVCNENSFTSEHVYNTGYGAPPNDSDTLIMSRPGSKALEQLKRVTR